MRVVNEDILYGLTLLIEYNTYVISINKCKYIYIYVYIRVCVYMC